MIHLHDVPTVILPNDREVDPSDTRYIHVYIIYDVTTTDYPGQYVLRRNVCKPGLIEVDAEPLIVSTDLAEVRRALPPELECLPRFTEDDPVILEVWL